MAFVSRIRRQSDYNTYPSSIPIVIDNGASYFRIGYFYSINPNFLLIANSLLLEVFGI
jgi:actin-related protein 5